MTDVAFWYDAQPCIYLRLRGNAFSIRCIGIHAYYGYVTRDVADPDGVQ